MTYVANHIGHCEQSQQLQICRYLNGNEAYNVCYSIMKRGNREQGLREYKQLN